MQSYNDRRTMDVKLLRRLMYVTLTAPYQDVKKIPKTEEKFMPLPGDKKQAATVTPGMLKKFEEARRKFKKQYVANE